MALEFFGHPFSSYTQKALLAFEENGIPFAYRKLGPEDPEAGARWKALWPLERFPIVVDGDRIIAEATAIIEYLHATRPGPVPLIPADPLVAVDVRMLDRFFDNYVSTPLQTIVFDSLRNEDDRDPFGVARQRTMLEKAYTWLDERMTGRTWAVGDAFSMADCAAAPALFYADWTHRIDPKFANVLAYRQRLLVRPSFAKLVDDARPFRAFFPLGAPDRD